MAGISTYAYQGINSSFLSYGSSFSINNNNTSSISSLNTGTGIFGTNNATTSSKAKSYISDLKSFSTQLANAAEKIVAGQPPVFSQMVAAMSGSTPPSGAGAKVKSASVQVEKVAAAQTNMGASLKSDAAVAKSGAQSFAIQTGNKSTTISVNIRETDSNKTAQQKIADAINKSNSGVTAKVQSDDKTGESSLILMGKETGSKNSFTVSDIYGGGLVAEYGLSVIQAKAQDAAYSVEGKNYTSASNKIEIGGAAAEITSTGTFNVDYYRANGSIKDAVKDLVNSFNDMLETAESYGSDRLQSRLQNAYSASSAALSKAGIYQGTDGSLRIDEELLNKSIENGTLEQALGAKDGSTGFAGRLNSIAKEAGQDPASFAISEYGGGGNTYNSLYDASYGSSFKQYAYNMKYSNMGQLFDYLM